MAALKSRDSHAYLNALSSDYQTSGASSKISSALLANLRNRRDPAEWARSIGITPGPDQLRFLKTQSKRIIVKCCRQWGKSFCAAIRAWWRATTRPGSLILIIAAAERQSTETFKKGREMEAYMDTPPEKYRETVTQVEFANGSRIVALPSTHTKIRGFSAPDEIILDEAAWVPDELILAVSPMLATNDGVLTLMSSPFGERGLFYEWFTGDDPGWERVEVNGFQCPRIKDEWLLREKGIIPDLWWRQEWMVEFVSTDEQLFTPAMIDALESDEPHLYEDLGEDEDGEALWPIEVTG